MAKKEVAVPIGDAGMRSELHYRKCLPKWRYIFRDFLLPIVRLETPILAGLQRRFRTPALDAYFATTANLGTHTFFMIILPILFWCGYNDFARAMINTLASGVFVTGFIKDTLCLPRPLSPPLQRISKSHTAALEYGFPSTHSTNAISTVVYCLYSLQTAESPWSRDVSSLLQFVLYFYAITIVIGRLYCGMHGFFDVVFGGILGLALAVIQAQFGAGFNFWVLDGPFTNIIIITLVVLVLVRIHPEPADDCPCFDDSVAFSGVFIGIQAGGWHFARSGFAMDFPIPATAPFSLHELGFIKAVLRIVLGVLIIFAWRGIMKPTLLFILPPIFRLTEVLGLALPRKFFLKASQYSTVPTLRRDDNIIPPASEIPRLLNALRHPRKRAISVGPQSEADAYEVMADRARRRKGSLPEGSIMAIGSPLNPQKPNGLPSTASKDVAISSAISSARASTNEDGYFAIPAADKPQGPFIQHLKDMAKRHAHDPVLLTPQTGLDETVFRGPPAAHLSEPSTPLDDFAAAAKAREGINIELSNAAALKAEDDKADAAMFERIQRPRVRYDVEVVTKLIVYAGIAWLACEGNPLLFELVGLGMGVRPTAIIR